MLGAVKPVWINPEDETIRGQVSDVLEAAISRLPGDYRIVLTARDIEELSTEETAQALGLTQAAVKSRLHRARLCLRHHLEDRFSKDHCGCLQMK
jgi:RNA polymerase sigma-70 factor (ECF subfamily)